ncbi:MAG TPA: toxin-antitoxin system [Thermoanaerobaculia bacterium]
MSELDVLQIDDDVMEKLQRRAHQNGRTAEEEVCEILRDAVKSESDRSVGLGTRLAARFRGIGLKEEIPELRGYPVEPIEFDP